MLAERAGDHRRAAVARRRARRRPRQPPQSRRRRRRRTAHDDRGRGVHDVLARRAAVHVAAPSSGPTARAQPRHAAGSRGCPRARPPSTTAATSTRATSQAAAMAAGRAARDLAERRPGRRPAPPRRRAAPGPTPARDVSAGTGPGIVRNANGSSDDEEDGLILTLQPDVEAVAARPGRAGDERPRPGRRPRPASDRWRWPVRRRSRSASTTRSSRPRANTDTARCGAWGVPSSVAHGRRARRADLPRRRRPPVAHRVNGPPNCHVSTTASGTGAPAPSRTVPLIVTASGRPARRRRAAPGRRGRGAGTARPSATASARPARRQPPAGSSNGVARGPRTTTSKRNPSAHSAAVTSWS